MNRYFSVKHCIFYGNPEQPLIKAKFVAKCVSVRIARKLMRAVSGDKEKL